MKKNVTRIWDFYEIPLKQNGALHNKFRTCRSLSVSTGSTNTAFHSFFAVLKSLVMIVFFYAEAVAFRIVRVAVLSSNR